ncbi:hypothetical protein BO79DRAFT_49567 [Aspergillus costaricaensis CBS 115574]|uniref:Uncharacterized protein n=1 Tax=Aspergillus costaricaensis CBS 115574 TaxID=1448317 RepID=A0ACD1I3Z6_9EURO|nr:hypothetical protein BO79DRAFT_49567 [Aspergillus costaricaensis CBS 115574]RAK84941.1 hypothetical protein BO79DRAFT_49567 [Aspergillus costaricaensis CBS 115574]
MSSATTLTASFLVSCLTFAAWRGKYIQGLRLMGMDQPWGESRAFPFGGGRRVGDTVKKQKSTGFTPDIPHITHLSISPCVYHCDSVLSLLFIYSCFMKGGEGESLGDDPTFQRYDSMGV